LGCLTHCYKMKQLTIAFCVLCLCCALQSNAQGKLIHFWDFNQTLMNNSLGTAPIPLQCINPVTSSGQWYPVSIYFSSLSQALADPLTNNQGVIIRWNFFGPNTEGRSGTINMDNVAVSGDSICPQITSQPISGSVCQGGIFAFTVGITGGINPEFQWQENNGSGFTNIANGGIFSGADSASLKLNGVSSGINGFQFRCLIFSASCDTLTSSAATLTINAAPNVTANSNPVSVCAGSFAQVTLNGAGASTYNWTGGVLNDVPFNLLSTSTYTVTGTDTLGCIATSVITVVVNQPPSLTANSSADSVCQGNSVTLSGSGAQLFTWSAGVNNGVPFSPPATSTYTVTGTDLSGCSATATVTVIVNERPQAAVTASATSICIGTAVSITASGGGTYSWNTGSIAGNINVSPDSTTHYTVTVSNGICPADTGITITVNKPPILTISPAQTICAGSTVTLNANGASTYSWSPSTGLTANNISNPGASPLIQTTYTVQGFNGICKSKDSVQVNVTPLPTAIACCSTTILDGNSAPLQVNAGPAGTTYSWSPPAGVASDTIPSTTSSPSQTTTYTITVTSGKCSARDSVIITVDIPCNIFVPNAFSPGGEGMNTKAYVFGLCIKQMDFAIFDKWGNKIFETTDQSAGWDGIYLGQPMDTGDYFYSLKVTTNANQTIQKKGDINLLR
jgi:gliding motility-associated-like protein